KGSAKLDIQLSRDTQITNNFFIRKRIRSILATKTIIKDEIGCGLNQMQYVVRPFYRLSPAVNVYAEYKHTDYIGKLKKIHRKKGESTKEDTLNVGLSFVF
ncbi:MAG: copper resistance protein B, partial [Alphaproteobacteria bacterium]|nr:copper resistance protein B [Alphaproteobacteria bacterium]